MLVSGRFAVLVGVVASGAAVDAAAGGAVFEIIGRNGTALPHPSGIGNRAGSSSWGIVTTGVGFLDGRLEFDDSFTLPMNDGESAPFDASDLVSFGFDHVEGAVGNGGIAPAFGFGGDASSIASAMGTVTRLGDEWRLVLGHLHTDLPAALPRNPGGAVRGTWMMAGESGGILATSIGDIPQGSPVPALLTVSSQYRGGRARACWCSCGSASSGLMRRGRGWRARC